MWPLGFIDVFGKRLVNGVSRVRYIHWLPLLKVIYPIPQLINLLLRLFLMLLELLFLFLQLVNQLLDDQLRVLDLLLQHGDLLPLLHESLLIDVEAVSRL